MKKQRCVIIGGGVIGDYEKIRSLLSEDDFCVYCDSGLKHRESLGAEPNLIVGDFDSYENPGLDVPTVVLPREKDDTDTVYGVKEGLMRGFDRFLLIGVTGKRLDHTLGNISILLHLDSIGKEAILADDYGTMEIVGEKTVAVSDDCAYFSLLNISGAARGIRVENAKYPLEDGEITSNYQYGISNQVLPGKTAQISVKEGKLLLIRIFEEEKENGL